MAFYLNAGWSFTVDPGINPDGAIILSSGIAYPSITRRKIDTKYPYMKNRYFDPQIYLERLDPHESPKPCFNLISYPWSGTKSLPEFDSDIYNQKQYKQEQLNRIVEIWNDRDQETDEYIVKAVAKAIDFQIHLGCAGIILPSPLSRDSTTDYSRELAWLDSGLNYIKQKHIKLPVFATLALSDACVRYLKVSENTFLDLVSDSISAREVDGVYILVEQMSEPSETRYLGNFNAIQSTLELIHQFSNENQLKVITNFFGPFGLVCSAIGAQVWATDWYKSLIRCRLADKIGGGRVFPSFWSYPMACDINLKSDIDTIFHRGYFPKVYEETTASKSLLNGLLSGKSVQDIPAWRYTSGNKTSPMEHYRLSMIHANNVLNNTPQNGKLDYIQQWLEDATNLVDQIKPILGSESTTKTDHVKAWKDGFLAYRLVHNI